MHWDDPSRLLMVAGMVTAVVGVGIIVVGIGRRAGYNVAAGFSRCCEFGLQTTKSSQTGLPHARPLELLVERRGM
jgi:hypothetical protein